MTALFVTDFCFTYVYSSHFQRTKFQYFRSYQNKNIDYVFLGSSRVENNINPVIIDSLTGKTSVNFGFQAVKIQDLLLLVKLMDDYNITYEKLFIQIDYIYNLEQHYSNVLEYQLVPFFKKDKSIQEHFSNNYTESFINTLKAPFLRYAYYDQKNGLREVVSNLRNSKDKFEINKGFAPLNGTELNSNFELPNSLAPSNFYFQQLKNYCTKNNIKVAYFCGAIRNDTKNTDFILKLKERIPNLIDLSNSIHDKYLFKDNLHLNRNGANVFSNKLISELDL